MCFEHILWGSMGGVNHLEMKFAISLSQERCALAPHCKASHDEGRGRRAGACRDGPARWPPGAEAPSRVVLPGPAVPRGGAIEKLGA